MINKTDDIRIVNTQELISPKDIISQFSPSESGIKTIIDTRLEIKNILDKTLKKFIIVVGPSSIHDIDAAKEYAVKLNNLKKLLSENSLLIIIVSFPSLLE